MLESGNGTETNPYLINDASHLNWIAKNVASSNGFIINYVRIYQINTHNFSGIRYNSK